MRKTERHDTCRDYRNCLTNDRTRATVRLNDSHITVRAEKMNTLSQSAKRLLEVRNALLNLHKTLVDFERTRYEKIVGAIQSPNQFLQLLTHDPWFAWLHPLSQLIVSMDEGLDEKEPLTAPIVDALVRQSGLLLIATESGQDFSGHYFEALQNEPDVVLAHAAVIKLIGRLPRP